MSKDEKVRSDADLLRLIAQDHARLAPNAYHSAATLLQIADRLSTPPAQAEASTLPGEVVLIAALRRAASDMQLTPGTNRGGAIVRHVQESRERIRQALAATPPTTPAVKRGLAKDLGQLRQIFEEWAKRDVNDQPVNPRTGVRPFGTGDLRRLIETIDRAQKAIKPAVESGEEEHAH